MSIQKFIDISPSDEAYWRAIILFGRNVASYKFALAKSLLEANRTHISIEDLAIPYAAHICEHLKKEDKQGTSASSRFLTACRDFNAGTISSDSLHDITIKHGFSYVLDAFHIVNNAQISNIFFEKYKKNGKTYLSLTNNLLKIYEQNDILSLINEIEARWRLVETAWALSLSRNALSVHYDSESKYLATFTSTRRKNITSARDALNGYQKGKCFYCMHNITTNNSDIDHFFPHTLTNFIPNINFDGIWNLVLSCRECNRGGKGKFAKVPDIKYLYRLDTRNNFFVSSHHPLRETLMKQTGSTEEKRQTFLKYVDKNAIDILIHRWHAVDELPAVF